MRLGTISESEGFLTQNRKEREELTLCARPSFVPFRRKLISQVGRVRINQKEWEKRLPWCVPHPQKAFALFENL
jgi:hypothetical protein